MPPSVLWEIQPVCRVGGRTAGNPVLPMSSRHRMAAQWSSFCLNDSSKLKGLLLG